MSAGRAQSRDWYDANPHAKSSFSRVATYRRCPAWYRWQYLDWHRSWDTPFTRVGDLVQLTLEKLLDVGPAADATFEDVLDRAHGRAVSMFRRDWEKARESFEADPNGYGAWDLPRDRYEVYLRNGLAFHLHEVRSRFDCVHPVSGAPLGHLDAVPDLRTAWLAARPLHAPPGDFEGMETIPAGYFQGEYDLVYDWTGGRRLIDIKASAGRSPFSTEIRTQLLAYTFLERALGRGRPEGIEAWFLGKDRPDRFAVPEAAELDSFDADVRALIDRSGHERAFGAWSEDDFPPEPSSVEGFPPRNGEPSAWCSICPAALVCPRSPRTAPPLGAGVDFRRLRELGESPVTVEGIVLGLAEPLDKEGKVTRRVTFANESGALTVKWDSAIVDRLIGEGLRAGATVRVDRLRPWRHPESGHVMLFANERSSVTRLDEMLF